MGEAGWSSDEIEALIAIRNTQRSEAPITSPGVDRHCEFIFNRHCTDIEAAMQRIGISSYKRVARGIEPTLGFWAANTNVIMTDEGIVTVGAQFFRFCGLVARAFARTIRMNPFLWEASDYVEEEGERYLKFHLEILSYWTMIYLSYSHTGAHLLVPFKPASRHEVGLFEQVARAMELFAIAHEYGHHHLGHGRAISPTSAHSEEFEADQFALAVCYEIDRYPLLMQNPYLTSGAGGLILLWALSTLRKFDSPFNQRYELTSDTHPGLSERVERFGTVALMKPAEFAALRNFRIASHRLMKVVDKQVLAIREMIDPKALADIGRLRF